MTQFFLGSVILFSSFVVSPVFAAEWQETNIQLLYGTDYKAANGNSYTKDMLTIEHTSSWAYGGNFFFFDISNPDSESDTEFYGEWSPAFSINKMGLLGLSQGSILKDTQLQFNFELPQGPSKRANLAGVTFQWDIGFDYLATQFLYRDTLGQDGHTGQFTLVWLKRFGTDAWPFEFSGFLDWAGSEGTSKDNLQTQPSLMLDFQRQSAGKVPLKLGVEYLYWQNKYGISGLLESHPQAKLTWIF